MGRDIERASWSRSARPVSVDLRSDKSSSDIKYANKTVKCEDRHTEIPLRHPTV